MPRGPHFDPNDHADYRQLADRVAQARTAREQCNEQLAAAETIANDLVNQDPDDVLHARVQAEQCRQKLEIYDRQLTELQPALAQALNEARSAAYREQRAKYSELLRQMGQHLREVARIDGEIRVFRDEVAKTIGGSPERDLPWLGFSSPDDSRIQQWLDRCHGSGFTEV